MVARVTSLAFKWVLGFRVVTWGWWCVVVGLWLSMTGLELICFVDEMAVFVIVNNSLLLICANV